MRPFLVLWAFVALLSPNIAEAQSPTILFQDTVEVKNKRFRFSVPLSSPQVATANVSFVGRKIRALNAKLIKITPSGKRIAWDLPVGNEETLKSAQNTNCLKLVNPRELPSVLDLAFSDSVMNAFFDAMYVAVLETNGLPRNARCDALSVLTKYQLTTSIQSALGDSWTEGNTCNFVNSSDFDSIATDLNLTGEVAFTSKRQARRFSTSFFIPLLKDTCAQKARYKLRLSGETKRRTKTLQVIVQESFIPQEKSMVFTQDSDLKIPLLMTETISTCGQTLHELTIRKGKALLIEIPMIDLFRLEGRIYARSDPGSLLLRRNKSYLLSSGTLNYGYCAKNIPSIPRVGN